MLEVFDFTFLNSPVSYILSFCIIITITYAEGPLMFFLYISNSFLNTILPNPGKSVNHSLPRRCLERFKIKCPKHPLSSRNKNGIWIKVIKSIQGTKLAGKFCYDLLKSIFVAVKMIRSSYDHILFPCIYINYKYFLMLKTDDSLMSTQNRIFFLRLMR